MSKMDGVIKRRNPVFKIVMETDAVILGELFPLCAPQTVGNFISLANEGFYDGLSFHRCIQGFIAQAGKANPSQPLPYCITGEFEFNSYKHSLLTHEYGSLCMARGGHYNSASSEFFIVTTEDERELQCLNGAYAIFGKVYEGMRIIEAISSVETDQNDKPIYLQNIRRIRVETFKQTYPFTKIPPPTSDVNIPIVKHRIKGKHKSSHENKKKEGISDG